VIFLDKETLGLGSSSIASACPCAISEKACSKFVAASVLRQPAAARPFLPLPSAISFIIALWFVRWNAPGCQSRRTRDIVGINSQQRARRLETSSGPESVPLMFPPGRPGSPTSPSLTGSPIALMTMGIERSLVRARPAGVERATMTSTLERASSAARLEAVRLPIGRSQLNDDIAIFAITKCQESLTKASRSARTCGDISIAGTKKPTRAAVGDGCAAPRAATPLN